MPLYDGLVAGRFEAVRTADADPAPVEEALLLPQKLGLVCVHPGGEGAAGPERG